MKTMTMGMLEARTGCTRDTIHFYLKRGLLHPGEKTGATTARYDRSHVDQLVRIRVLRDAGISTEDIARWLPSLATVSAKRLRAVAAVLQRLGRTERESAQALNRDDAGYSHLVALATDVAHTVSTALDDNDPKRAVNALDEYRAALHRSLDQEIDVEVAREIVHRGRRARAP